MPITATADPTSTDARRHFGWRRSALAGVIGVAAPLAVLLSLSVGASDAAADPCVTPVACAGTTTSTTEPTPSKPPPSSPSPSPSQTQPQPQAQPQPQTPPAGEQTGGDAQLFQLLNDDRAQHGLGPLGRRADLDAIARSHSADMAASRTLSHNDSYFTPASHDRFNALVVGENVAQNPTSVENANARLMASPHHRDNILDARFTAVGVSVYLDSAGTYWITEDFLQPRAASAARPAAVVRSAAVAPPKQVAAGVVQLSPAEPGTGGGDSKAELVATITTSGETARPSSTPIRRAGSIGGHRAIPSAVILLAGLAFAAAVFGVRALLPGAEVMQTAV